MKKILKSILVLTLTALACSLLLYAVMSLVGGNI